MNSLIVVHNNVGEPFPKNPKINEHRKSFQGSIGMGISEIWFKAHTLHIIRVLDVTHYFRSSLKTRLIESMSEAVLAIESRNVLFFHFKKFFLVPTLNPYYLC